MLKGILNYLLPNKMENGSPKKGAVAVDLNVSASENSKGGLRYDVILAEPSVSTPPRVPSSPSMPNLSREIIQQKIMAATERRQSLEAERLATLAVEFNKIEEASKKRKEVEESFINSTKENLDKDMETHIENREAKITELKVKLSNHNTNKLLEVRQQLATSLTEFEEKSEKELQSKLEAAEKNREKAIQERLEHLKKHDEKVEMVRSLKRNSSVLEDSATEQPMDQ